MLTLWSAAAGCNNRMPMCIGSFSLHSKWIGLSKRDPNSSVLRRDVESDRLIGNYNYDVIVQLSNTPLLRSILLQWIMHAVCASLLYGDIIYSVYIYIYIYIYYGGNWMLESDWLTNILRSAIIFRETHGEHSSRQVLTALHVHITSPNDLSYFKGPYSKITQTHKDTGQTNTYCKQ